EFRRVLFRSEASAATATVNAPASPTVEKAMKAADQKTSETVRVIEQTPSGRDRRRRVGRGSTMMFPLKRRCQRLKRFFFVIFGALHGPWRGRIRDIIAQPSFKVTRYSRTVD